jgi:hypothetical protein
VARLFAPYFLALSIAYSGWMQLMANEYHEKASELGLPFDQELLGPIVTALVSLDQSGG